MNNINKIACVMIYMISMSPTFAQNNVSDNFEASAKIQNFCQIQANDINFGVVSLPLTAQNANAQMNVRCTNSTPYKIDLEYGGNTLLEANLDYTIQFSTRTTEYGEANFNRYYVRDKKNVGVGYLDCPVHSSRYGTIYFTHEALSQIYGYSAGNALRWIADTKNVCNNSIPRGWAGAYNSAGLQPINGEPKKSEYGAMKGSFKSDNLAYQITLPEDSNKPWIANVNSYTAVGNGTAQVIEMRAKIVPDKSSSKYIAADTYLDTVMATIAY